MNPEILEKLSLIGAKLIGSREIALRPESPVTIRVDTDWDFSAQHSPEAEKQLESFGFKKSTAKQYHDNQCVAIYKYADIDVILHADEALYRKVWGSLCPNFYFKYLWKRAGNDRDKIRDIMNQLYEVAKS